MSLELALGLLFCACFIALTSASGIAVVLYVRRRKGAKTPASQLEIAARIVAGTPVALFVFLYVLDPKYMSFFFSLISGAYHPLPALMGIAVLMLSIISYVVMSITGRRPLSSISIVLIPIFFLEFPAVIIVVFAPSIPTILGAFR